MSKAGVLAIVILIIGLTVVTAGSVLPFGQQPVSANNSESSASPGTVTHSSSVGSGESVWTRVRWLFAGVGLSAVLLAARRQVVVLNGYRENPDYFGRVNRRRAERSYPVAAGSDTLAINPDRDWLRSPTVSIATDR